MGRGRWLVVVVVVQRVGKSIRPRSCKNLANLGQLTFVFFWGGAEARLPTKHLKVHHLHLALIGGGGEEGAILLILPVQVVQVLQAVQVVQDWQDGKTSKTSKISKNLLPNSGLRFPTQCGSTN